MGTSAHASVMHRPWRTLPVGQIVFGGLVILIGILLLLETTDVAPTAELLRFVPSVIIVLGLWALVQSRFRTLIGPVLLVGLGSAWQLVALGYATVDQVVAFWPVLVIALGVSVLLGQFRTGVQETGNRHTTAVAVFGGVEKRNTSDRFTGADLTAMFGGVELDLRETAVADRPAHVNAVAMFGGVEIAAPRDWNVRMDVLPVFGGAGDERTPERIDHEEVDLVVTGFAAFGGVTVTD